MKRIVAFRNFANAPNKSLKGSSSRKNTKCGGLLLALYLTIFSAEIKRFLLTPKKNNVPGGTHLFIYWKLAVFRSRTGAGA
jgi:hypothetical protein